MIFEGAETISELVVNVNTPSYITIDGVKNFVPVTQIAVTVTKGTSHTINVEPLNPDQWNEKGQNMDLTVEGDQTIECIFTPRSNLEAIERPVYGPEPSMHYGGFWRRLAAFLIDIVTVFVIFFVLEYILIYLAGFASGNPPILIWVNDWIIGIENNPLFYGEIGAFLLVFYIFYFTVLESSLKQATLGKQALGLKVVNAKGERLSLGNAFVRSCSKILSGLIAGIGFFMISFTDKKQGLHDYIAKTYVIKVGFRQINKKRETSIKKRHFFESEDL